jgi:hypothetical protein
MSSIVEGLAAQCEGGLGTGPLAIAEALRLPVVRDAADGSRTVRAALLIARDWLSEDGIDDDATACELALELLGSQALRADVPTWAWRLVSARFAASGTFEIAFPATSTAHEPTTGSA